MLMGKNEKKVHKNFDTIICCLPILESVEFLSFYLVGSRLVRFLTKLNVLRRNYSIFIELFTLFTLLTFFNSSNSPTFLFFRIMLNSCQLRIMCIPKMQQFPLKCLDLAKICLFPKYNNFLWKVWIFQKNLTNFDPPR